ncbi:MAG: PKD domain-containing protein [Bernardetiaceae bacterium]|jgi:hypothetical protein|nr:PKD domain-containing protein [Bernardetiaceae bacterium]
MLRKSGWLLLGLWWLLGACATRNTPFVDFSFAPKEPVVGRPVKFTNLTINASGYEWYVNGLLVSNDPEMEYIFEEAGPQTVTLNAKSPGGDASQGVIIDVKDPRDDMEGVYRGTFVTSGPGGNLRETVMVLVSKGVGPLEIYLDMSGTNAVPPRLGNLDAAGLIALDYTVSGIKFSGFANCDGKKFDMSYTAVRLRDNFQLGRYTYTGTRFE